MLTPTVFLFTITYTVIPGRAFETKPGQCPCYINPTTNSCLRYDSSVQATTLDEAIDFFVDMSLFMEKKPPEQETPQRDHACQSRECKTCRRMLRSRLRAVGLFEAIYGPDGYRNFIEPVSFNPDAALDETCDKYRFARKNTDTTGYFVDSALSGENVNEQAQTEDTPGDQLLRGRGRRAATQVTLSADVIGTRYNLSCTTKGSAVDGNTSSGLLSLCSKCWAWRQLPPNYFPQFINEMVCHDGDTECLSGYAVCGTATRTVEVLRNDTTKMTTVSLTAGSFCECQVRAGSAISHLVTGSSTGLTSH